MNEPRSSRKVDLQSGRWSGFADVHVLRALDHVPVRVIQRKPVLPAVHDPEGSPAELRASNREERAALGGSISLVGEASVQERRRSTTWWVAPEPRNSPPKSTASVRSLAVSRSRDKESGGIASITVPLSCGRSSTRYASASSDFFASTQRT